MFKAQSFVLWSSLSGQGRKIHTVSHQGSRVEKGPTDHPVQLLSNAQSSGHHACLSLHTSNDRELTPFQGGIILAFIWQSSTHLLAPVQRSPSFLSIPHYWNKHTSSEGENSTLCNSHALDPHQTGIPLPHVMDYSNDLPHPLWAAASPAKHPVPNGLP